MIRIEKANHWNKIYKKNDFEEMSWFQKEPSVSLDYLHQFKLSKEANIIDVGGGESLFVDHLLLMGFKNIFVLDISEVAIHKAQKRLGSHAEKVTWIVGDVLEFNSSIKFDLWHDRATFHFLTVKRDVDIYIDKINEYVNPGSAVVLATFSSVGPSKCSGLPIQNYSLTSLQKVLNGIDTDGRGTSIDHFTPQGNAQNFLFYGFRKR
jgi:2-polyprenyl-3-methyl-5-hydroxy-6-metoxy-1,4-benzoquinol methylase